MLTFLSMNYEIVLNHNTMLNLGTSGQFELLGEGRGDDPPGEQ